MAFEDKSLEKALDIYSRLITGSEIKRGNADTKALYEEYFSNSEVYEIVGRMAEKLNLAIYEYNDTLFMSAGDGNRVFGYTNDEMKHKLGLKLNKELYLVYFIMYHALAAFYKDSATYQVKEYVKQEELLASISETVSTFTKDISIYGMTDLEEDSFKTIALMWDELPLVTNNDQERNKASRASRVGYLKLTFNFLTDQKLFAAVEDRYYPTDRFKAIAENYFEEYKGHVAKALGGDENA